MRRRIGAARRESERADDFIDSYARWREACADVRAAYVGWVDRAPDERGVAFDEYRAALDREEQAARVHSTCVLPFHSGRARPV